MCEYAQPSRQLLLHTPFKLNKCFLLCIRATDGDKLRPLSSTAAVRVRVLDVNDVAPLFTAPQYLVKAREDLPLGAVVGMVHAHDPDLYQGCNSIDIFEFWVQLWDKFWDNYRVTSC